MEAVQRPSELFQSRDMPNSISFITKDHSNPSDDLIAEGAEGAGSL
jgi:hypothetical protein